MVRKKKKKEADKEEKVDEEGEEEEGINKEKQEKQVKLFLILMASIIFFIFLVYAFVQEMRKIEYAGLEFLKVKRGNLELYHAKFPVADVTGNTIGYLPFYFRQDPRTLRWIEIQDKIRLKKDVGVYPSEEISSCEDSNLAVTSLSLFLVGTGRKPFSATTNKSESENFNVTLVNCSNEEYSVVKIEKSDNSKIEKEENCYILEVKDCEIMNVAERFMLGIYAHSNRIEI